MRKKVLIFVIIGTLIILIGKKSSNETSDYNMSDYLDVKETNFSAQINIVTDEAKAEVAQLENLLEANSELLDQLVQKMMVYEQMMEIVKNTETQWLTLYPSDIISKEDKSFIENELIHFDIWRIACSKNELTVMPHVDSIIYNYYFVFEFNDQYTVTSDAKVVSEGWTVRYYYIAS